MYVCRGCCKDGIAKKTTTRCLGMELKFRELIVSAYSHFSLLSPYSFRSETRFTICVYDSSVEVEFMFKGIMADLLLCCFVVKPTSSIFFLVCCNCSYNTIDPPVRHIHCSKRKLHCGCCNWYSFFP